MGHFLGVGAHAFRRDAVVGGEDVDRLVQGKSAYSLTNRNHSSCDVLETSQAPQWFRQAVQVSAGTPVPFDIRFFNSLRDLRSRSVCRNPHTGFFSVRAAFWPAK